MREATAAWSRKESSAIYTSPAVGGDRVIYGTASGELRARSVADGEEI